MVLATDLFDEFLERNDLRDFGLESADEHEIERRFVAADLPAAAGARSGVVGRRRASIPSRSVPRACSRIPSTSQFAGIYATYMLRERSRPGGRSPAPAAHGDQTRLRLHVQPRGQAISRRDAVPPRGREDGGGCCSA